MKEPNSDPLRLQRATDHEAPPRADDAPEFPDAEEIGREATTAEHAHLAPFLEDPCIASLYGAPVEF